MMDDSNFPMLHLLEVICEKSPPEMDVPDHFGSVWKKGFIRVGCPQHPTHTVSPLGFLLLEEVEGGFSSALQEVELVDFQHMPDLLVLGLGSRVQRQQGRMAEMHVVDTYCSNGNSVEAMSTLLQNCDPGHLNIGRLSVDDIGYRGWAMLAKGFFAAPGCVLDIYASRKHMKEGRREDLRTIWESLTRDWDMLLSINIWPFHKADGEEGWEALQQTLDATTDYM